MSHARTCKTCSLWEPFEKARPGVVPVDGEAEGGYCRSSKLIEAGERNAEADMLVYSYMEGGNFWTGPSFGCIHHRLESKEPS